MTAKRTMSLAAAMLSGIVFGLGLGVAGMTRPEKVTGFLDFAGAWDPSLAMVMAGAIGVHVGLLRLARRRSTPLFAAHFHLPTRTDIDARLVAGAAIFGVGWGLGGYCPGPGIVSVASGTAASVVFVVAMAAGVVAQQLVGRASESIHAPAGSKQENT